MKVSFTSFDFYQGKLKENLQIHERFVIGGKTTLYVFLVLYKITKFQPVIFVNRTSVQ